MSGRGANRGDQPKSGEAEISLPVTQAFREIELGLLRDDPDFSERYRRLERADVTHALAVFLLLSVSAVFLIVGLATQSGSMLFGGGFALVASFAVDDHYQRKYGSRSGQ